MFNEIIGILLVPNIARFIIVYEIGEPRKWFHITWINLQIGSQSSLVPLRIM